MSFLYGQEYYFINKNGEDSVSEWLEMREDYKRNAVGNVFPTREEAKKVAERLKMRKKMLEMGGRTHFKPKGDNHSIHLFYQENGDTSLVIECHGVVQDIGGIYFDTFEDAINAIEELGEDKIIEYMFD